MPRRNKRKTEAAEPHIHAPSPFSRGYKPRCRGCAFVGANSACLTSDGNCLKVPLPGAREVGDAEIVRRTDTASAER
ncbi:MAG: hypothetical protein FWF88_11630 [Peptococcaceae bacterium]|nr:hypothetical protein [Peptococcaceae bacterium]